MIYAAIVAGGTGSRMGSNVPKQFLEISGKPVLIHTISAFAKMVDRICIACHKDYVDYTREIAEKYFDFPIDIIPGGADRMESVEAIVNHFLSDSNEDDILLTHDAVRPFVSEKMIKESIENARQGHFCTIAVNSTDTVCIADGDGMIGNVPDRSKVFNIQTPQTFNLRKLAEMLEMCPDKNKYTDLCGLALSLGENVKMVEGSPENIKITVPADIKIAETILEKRYENR